MDPEDPEVCLLRDIILWTSGIFRSSPPEADSSSSSSRQRLDEASSLDGKMRKKRPRVPSSMRNLQTGKWTEFTGRGASKAGDV